jgi:hypothetical protein
MFEKYATFIEVILIAWKIAFSGVWLGGNNQQTAGARNVKFGMEMNYINVRHII